MSKTKCTKQTIAEEQARLKKEPFMLDDVEKWMYYEKEETSVEKFKKGSFKNQVYSKKSSSKKQRKNIK